MADEPDEPTPLEHLVRRVDESTAANAPGSAIIPAGHPAPSPASFDDIGIAHAIDGDGTALCRPHLPLEQVNDYYWKDVPDDQRCKVCAATLGDRPGTNG